MREVPRSKLGSSNVVKGNTTLHTLLFFFCLFIVFESSKRCARARDATPRGDAADGGADGGDAAEDDAIDARGLVVVARASMRSRAGRSWRRR